VLTAAGAEPEQVPGRRAGAGFDRLLEPGVRVGAVVGHDVDDDADAQRVRFLDERLGFGQAAEERVDRAVVGHVVASVGHRRGVPRVEPHRVDPERGQIAQVGPDAGQIPDTVAVAVREAARIDLVDGGRPPPRQRQRRPVERGGFGVAHRLPASGWS
jgi:hypothetical protein